MSKQHPFTLLKKFRDLARFFIDEEVRSVARRLFITNSVDALLAYAGAVVGSYLSGNTDPMNYVAMGLGMALAISMLSNFVAVFLVEEAERRIELKEISKHLLHSVDNTILAKAPKLVALYVATWSAIGALSFPALASTPFAASLATRIPIHMAVTASLCIVISILFALGTYLGKLIGRNPWGWGLRMALIGLAPLAIALIAKP